MKLAPTITIDHLDVKIAPDIQSRLRWKEYQLLSLLVENSPKVVTREELVTNIWKGTYCSNSTINQTIKSIRQKLGDNDHKIIKTIPRIGYIIEQKQMINIISGKESSSEKNEKSVSSSTIDNATSTKQFSDHDEITDAAHSLSFSSHTRLSRPTNKTSSLRLDKFKQALKISAIRFFQIRNKFFFFLIITIILMTVVVYFLSIIKISLASHTIEWGNFNDHTSSITLICPLGFSNISSASNGS